MTEATKSTALVPVDQRAKLALATTERESKLIEAAASTKDIVACADKTGREMIHKAAMGHRALRLDIKSTGEAAREDANKFQKAVIAEAARLTALIEPEEARLLAIRDGFDAEQERIRQAAIDAERARIARVQAAIAHYRDMPLKYIGKSSGELYEVRDAVTTDGIPTLEYKNAESDEVHAARSAAIAKLDEMHNEAFEREEAEKRAAAEREAEAKRQAEQRAELERQQAELAAARAKAEAEAKAAREKLEAEAAELRKVQEAALAVEREAMAKERAAMEEERARVAEEVAAMERQREEAQKAAAMLAPAPEPEPDDTRPVITVKLEPADETPPPAPEVQPTLRLGQMSERLKFMVTADFLLFLGFAHSGTDKAAKLFHEREFPSICAAISRHVLAVSQA